MRKTQVTITVAALGLAVSHVVLPEIEIDGITLALLILAAVPWVTPLLRAVELPGGIKLEMRKLEQIEEEAEQAGLLAEPKVGAPPGISVPEPEYSFLLVADEDPALALAGLRIELERRLADLAEERGIRRPHRSVGALLRALSEEGVISREVRSVLEDMVGTLNSAAHGAEVDPLAAQWVIDVGPRLLEALDQDLNR